MKRLLIVLSLGATILVSQSAFADGRYYSRGYDRWGPASFYSGGFDRHYYRNYDRNRFRFYNDRFYNNFGRYHRGNYVSISYGTGPWVYGGYYGRGYSRHDAGDFLGGLVVGSLLTSSYQSNREYDRVVYRSAPVTRTREVVVNRSPIATTPRSGRKLLRDLQGNCFEISRNGLGDEVRVEIDPGLCEF
jgi:hypothetical protein